MSNYAFSPEQFTHLTKCLLSPEYFIETFCWLEQKASAGISETSGVIPFEFGSAPDEPFYFQRRILRWLHSREDILALKSRRVGCSWIVAAYAAWLINFHQGVWVTLISRNTTEAEKVLKKIKFILKNLAFHDSPDIRKATSASFLCNQIHTDSAQLFEIGWQNKSGEVTVLSTAESLSTTDNSARGDDVTFMVFDELAFYEHPDKTRSSAMKSLARGGHHINISTPNAIGDVFHRLCARGDLAEQGSLGEPLGYKYIKIHWSEAGITQKQINRSSTGDTEDQIAQEWEMMFIVPGVTVFNPIHLAACYKPPDEYPEVATELEEYRRRVDNGDSQYIYASGVDTIEGKAHRKGTEKDWNSWVSLTRGNVQAFHYRDQSEIAAWAGKTIDNAAGGRMEVRGKTSILHEEWPGTVGIEKTGVGLTTWNNHQLPRDSFSDKHGVDMNAKMKRGAVQRFVLKVETHGVVITSLSVYQQLMVFQNLDGRGKYGAPSGYNDDDVMAIIMASDIVDQLGQLQFPFGDAAGVKRAVQVGTTNRRIKEEQHLGGGPALDLPIHGHNLRIPDNIPALPDIDLGIHEQVDKFLVEDILSEDLPTQ